jgi:signal transduction histidine kinase
VLTNLIDNAIRHTPAGGRIVVRLRCADDAVEVQVIDNGPGVPERLRASLFARPSFQSGGREFDGGLGLVIVQRILQLHGSSVQLIQEAGTGAVFRFHLAASVDAAARQAARPEDARRIRVAS